MDNNGEIKKANRKALPKFILILVGSMIVGGLEGFFSAKFGLDALSDNLKAAGEFFGLRIAPWLMLALAIIQPIACAPFYRKAKKLLAGWDGENEEVSDAIEETLSIIIWMTGTALIISFFLIAAAYSGGFAAFDHEENTVPYFVSIAAFFSIMIEALIFQQKSIDAAKKTNPEKTASIYDTKFHKKWMDSCDEAEKIMIGKCAFKAYSATNAVCPMLAIFFALSALVFGTGFLPTLAVCVIWLVNHWVYCKEAFKYSKAGNLVL